MMKRCATFSTGSRARRRSRDRRAATLIEVLGGLMLLGGVLVGMLLTEGRATRQAAQAERRLRAVAAADALLGQWWRDPRAFPAAGDGVTDGASPFIWRITPIGSAPAADFAGRVERLEIFDTTDGTAAAPLASVEVVVPQMPPNGGIR